MKRDLKSRVVSLPAVSDLIVGQAVLNLIGVGMDQTISDASLAWRIDADAPRFIIRRYSGWRTFRRLIRRNISEFQPVLVVSDIVGYYDYVHLEQLTDQIREHGVRKELVDLIELQLRAWQARRRLSALGPLGLPQGSNPIAGFYANFYLRTVDDLLERELKVTHLRYVDDLAIHVRSAQEAREVVKHLDGCLRELGLSLNSAKTNWLEGKKIERKLGFRLEKAVRRIPRDAKVEEVVERNRRHVQQALEHESDDVLGAALDYVSIIPREALDSALARDLTEAPHRTKKWLDALERLERVHDSTLGVLLEVVKGPPLWDDQERELWESLGRVARGRVGRAIDDTALTRVRDKASSDLVRSEAALAYLWRHPGRTGAHAILREPPVQAGPRLSQVLLLARGLEGPECAKAALLEALDTTSGVALRAALFLFKLWRRPECAQQALRQLRLRRPRTRARGHLHAADALLLAFLVLALPEPASKAARERATELTGDNPARASRAFLRRLRAAAGRDSATRTPGVFSPPA
ncbi:MAG: RNA-directed DNA polymerase [Vicinamibacteria bacterium]